MELKSVTKKEGSRAELVIEVSAEQFQKALNTAYNQAKKDIYIPGFRKGKAPRKVIEGMYGKEVFYEDAINVLYPEVFPEAVEKAELNVVGTPGVDDLNVSEDGVLTLTMSVDVYPEVEMGEYKGITAYKPAVEVTDEEVDEEIENLRTRNARIVSVDRPVQEGDTAVIDFEGFVDGVAFDGGKGEGYELKIGSGTFIPGFEDALIGVSAGENKDVEVTFPEDYTAELAGKAAVFKCVVHEVKETQKPELDDEFAIDLGSDNLEALKAETKQKLIDSRETDAQNTFESNVMREVASAMKAEIPQSMINDQLDKLIENFSYQVQMAGMRMEDYMNMIGADMASMRSSYAPMAQAQVKSELAMNKIAELEGIEISDEDVDAEYTRLAEAYEMDVENVKQYMPADDIKYSLKLDRASKLVIEAAVATSEQPDLSPEDIELIQEVAAQAAERAEAEKSEEE
ncbi:MAG: trigger factor [Ruminococcaceae bacterium]|nr:trigger factor [Oscillospiraceae bacterium]